MKLKVGYKFFNIREERKLSQEEMADLLGISQSAYSRMERGETSMPLGDLMRYAEKLGIPIQELLPETMIINNRNEGNAGGIIFCNQYYYYGESSQNSQITLLQQRIVELERLLDSKKTHKSM